MLARISMIMIGSLLSACGGSSNETTATSPKMLRQMSATSSARSVAASPAVMPNQKQNDPGDDEYPSKPPPTNGSIHGLPAGTRYIVEAPFISQVPLRIVVGASAYADLCLYNADPQKQLCTTIDSPLPSGMDVEYTDGALLDPSADVRFLAFIPVVGNSDPQGLTAQRFIEALARAAAIWGNYLEQHPQLVAQTNSAFYASGASNLLLVGTSRVPKRKVDPKRTVNSTYENRENCYAEMEALGLCFNGDDDPPPDIDPDIPVVWVPGERPEPPPYVPPTPEPPPYEPPTGGGGGDIGQYSKDGLLAQLTPVAPPCGKLGPGGLLCSIEIFGKRPPALPPKKADPVDHGHQYFAPQVLCDWHILCNEGQEPRDNDRGASAGTSGKTQGELDQICVDINIREINVCKTIIKAKGRSIQDYMRELEICKAEANKRMYACFDTAKQLTDNGAHPAP